MWYKYACITIQSVGLVGNGTHAHVLLRLLLSTAYSGLGQNSLSTVPSAKSLIIPMDLV